MILDFSARTSLRRSLMSSARFCLDVPAEAEPAAGAAAAEPPAGVDCARAAELQIRRATAANPPHLTGRFIGILLIVSWHAGEMLRRVSFVRVRVAAIVAPGVQARHWTGVVRER